MVDGIVWCVVGGGVFVYVFVFVHVVSCGDVGMGGWVVGFDRDRCVDFDFGDVLG